MGTNRELFDVYCDGSLVFHTQLEGSTVVICGICLLVGEDHIQLTDDGVKQVVAMLEVNEPSTIRAMKEETLRLAHDEDADSEAPTNTYFVN